jgi:hypothetical protein
LQERGLEFKLQYWKKEGKKEGGNGGRREERGRERVRTDLGRKTPVY